MHTHQLMFTGQCQVEYQEVEFDERPAEHEVITRTEYSFISAGTELANYTGTEPLVFQKGSWCAYPWRPGYANVGTVSAVGSAVRGWRAGDRLFTLGPHAGMARHADTDLLLPVPATLDPALAVASRMAGVATSAITVFERPLYAPTVLVFGLGMVGNLAAQTFRILGCRVVAVDPLAARRAVAEQCGLTHVTAGDAATVGSFLRATFGVAQAEIVVDATGLTRVILEALPLCAPSGQFILLGSPRAAHEGNLTALLSDIHLRNISLRGALEWNVPVAQAAGMWGAAQAPTMSLTRKQQLIFDWMQRGELRLAPLVSHRLPAAHAREAYKGLRQQPELFTGVVLDWRGERQREAKP